MRKFSAFSLVIPLLSIGSTLLLAQGEVTAVPRRTDEQTARLRALGNRLLRLRAETEIGSDNANLPENQVAVAIRSRAAALANLIHTDPNAAQKFVFAPEVVADVARAFPEFASELESYGVWTGEIERWVVDDAERKTSRESVWLRTPQQKLQIHVAGSAIPALVSGQLVELTGVRLGSDLLASAPMIKISDRVSASSVLSSQPGPHTVAAASSVCSTTGPQKTAVLLATFPGVTPPSTVTPRSVHDTFFGAGHSLDGYWREASYGATSATGDVFGWYTLSSAYTCSTIDQARDEAIKMAVAAGANFQNYNRVVLIYPNSGCVAGFAQIGCGSLSTPSGTINASTAYIQAGYMDGDQGVYFAAHEAGHTLGLQHAGTRSYGTEPLGPLTSGGAVNEVGDNFSLMGSETLGHYSAQHKAEQLGWLSAGVNYEVVQGSGVWTLQPFETSPTSLKALKIQRGTGNNQWLWLEYRQPVAAYDSTLYFQQPSGGAYIHYADSTTGAYTQLLNFQPQLGSWYAPALLAGQTWTDPYTNLTISVQSATATSMTVAVSYGPAPCAPANPTIAMSPSNPSAAPGKTVTYSVVVTNNDSAGCSGSSFAVGSTQPTAWTTSFSATSLSLAPGQSGSVTMTKTVPSSATTGVYAVNSTAGNGVESGSGSANVTVTSPALAVSVSTAGSTYTRGQTVPLAASVSYGGSAAAGASVTFTVTRPNGVASSKTVPSDSTGKAVWSYKVGPKDPIGTYSFTAKVVYSSQTVTSNPGSFTVQ